ncbi:adenylate/guanylate cyclase domain-containing protein [Reyranella sp.]|jgi:adenylate cyclase|uniref:adenylate/guanylate cyclase domain-containing protein n=1 Tax=Reyranella sp. TaxID=1929291 RepID=UPI002F94701A
MQRKLAAVLAADVVGYSRLMGRDESGTLVRLREHRKKRLEPTLARYGGRLIKLMGDGALVEFASACDALSAAIEFQQAVNEMDPERPEADRIIFRIGLHLGDMIIEGDDLYGDGVNIAARLETQAPAGGILVSRTVHEAVTGRLKATFADLGCLSLKNIERPIQAFSVKWEPADWQCPSSLAPERSYEKRKPSSAEQFALPDKPSIAVLPFQNLSVDPDQEYFADGMVEDIITALSHFKSLLVIARNSSFAYKGRSPDIRQVGRELGVRYVLEGSVRKFASKVRITSQLIDCENGAHIWADRLDGALEDIFELQDQVTTKVVGAITPKLNQAEIQRVKRKSVQRFDAYDCFLRGLAHSYVVTRETHEEAARLLYRAIQIDPDFSTPYGLATALYTIRKAQGWVVDSSSDESEVRRLAFHVAAIGSDDALALSWTGFSLVYVCREFDTGADLIDQALSINQNLAQGWANRAVVSTILGEHDIAIEQVSHVFRLSPIDPEIYRSEVILAFAHLCLGRYAEASKWATKALARQSNFLPAMRVATAAHALTGNMAEARRILGQMCRLDPSLTQSSYRNKTFFRRTEDIERFVEGFRRAGMAE